MVEQQVHPFDHYAVEYDSIFTDSHVGRLQRDQVWRYIEQMRLPKQLSVLELNCGTGVDAQRWAEHGAKVLATDISLAMVETASRKYPHIAFRQLNITESPLLSSEYNLVFSNFGGFNCLSPEEVQNYFKTVGNHLPDTGCLVLVIMGKKCSWDRWYMRKKRRWSDVARRNTAQAVEVPLGNTMVKTWYYSPEDIRQLAEPAFKVTGLKPIGLFVPPSYLAPYFEQHSIQLRFLGLLDRLFGWKWFANAADHFLIVLNKC